MKKLTPLAAAICCGLLFGCSSITHQRPVTLADGKVYYETEKASGFFSKVAVDGLSSTTKDKDYSHAFRAKTANASGDTESITASGAALGALIGTAAKAAAKP